MERVRILAASVALMEFTVPELAAYSRANERTVRSILRRDTELFEELPNPPGAATTGPLTSGMNEAEGAPPRGPGRPPTRWRVADPQRIMRLLAGLQSELAEAQQGAGVVPQLEQVSGVYQLRLAAVKVAQDAVARAWEEPDPELRCILAETAVNNLADADPRSDSNEADPQATDWWNDASLDLRGTTSTEEESLRQRAMAVATLAQLIEAESRNSTIGAEQLANAALAISRLDGALPEARIREFLARLADSAIASRRPAGLATVFGKIVTAKAPVSVSDVAAGTGLEQGEVERALRPLLIRKYVVPYRKEDGPESGWPPSPVQLNEAEHRAIGISIHPKKVIGVLTDLRASYSTVREQDLKIKGQSRVDVDLVVEAVSSLVKEFLKVRSDIIGLGVDLPGHVNGRLGEVIFSPLLKQRNIPLKEKLEAATGLPTVVENDANALAIYEQWFGDGTEMRDFAVALLPERGGLGSGIVSNNRIVYGATGAAGELGHIEFEPNGVKCDCEKLGCLETVAGIGGILREVVKSHGKTAGTLSAAMSLAKEDKATQRAFKRSAEALGWGIAVILSVFDPERTIIFAPAQLVDPEQYAARLFMGIAEEVATKRAFSTAAQSKLYWRPLPDLPVLPYEPAWRPHPQKGAIGASAVLGRVISRPLEWAG